MPDEIHAGARVRSLELFEEPQVVFEEPADVGDFVFAHGGRGKSCILRPDSTCTLKNDVGPNRGAMQPEPT